MYYSQNTKNITTVILSFDGVMTSLSKLRFNYYRRFCKLYDQQLDVKEYYHLCASYQTMYNSCPIPSRLITKGALHKKVEEDLYAYSQHHGVKLNEGFDELYEIIKFKKLRLIYTSSHSSIYTEPLFALTGSLYRPHEFSFDYTETFNQYKDRPNEVLVIASDMQTLQLANEYRFNVIYYPSIQMENDEITIRSLAVIHHLLEAINIILDSSRLPKNQYILIDNHNTLEENYNKVIQTANTTLHAAIQAIYEKEQENVIGEIYFPEETVITQQREEQIDLSDNDEKSTEVHEQEVNKKDVQEKSFIQKLLEEVDYEEEQIEKNKIDSEELFEKTIVLNTEDLEEEQSFTLDPIEGLTEDTNTDLDSIIDALNNKDQKQEHTKIFTKEELKEFGMSEDDLYDEDEEDDDHTPILILLFNSFIYAAIDTIIFMLIYLAMSIGLYDWIFKPGGILSFLQPIIKIIYSISMRVFGGIASTLGNFINASPTLVEGIAVFSFITIILWIILFLIDYIRERKN